MGLFGGGQAAEHAKTRAQLTRIEQALADLRIVIDHQEQGFSALHGRLGELGTATAASVQGVADQILHLQLPEKAPEPAPAPPAPAGPRPAAGRPRSRPGG